MNAHTATVPALGRAYTVRFTPELLILLAAGVLALVVLAFFLGRRAEQTHQRLWGPRKTSEAPGLGRPEPLPEVRLASK
ncbi:MAG: hypothetical protein KIS92_13620 [Planctomycetota bacterium]|nr:hypothetical protein [Planctomycetota bacterium]